MSQLYEEDYASDQWPAVYPRSQSLRLVDLTFRYAGAGQPDVLSGVNLTIPFGYLTAIVGPSGSGKTTLLKLLLGLYRPTHGEIRLDDVPLAALDAHGWRARCGVVIAGRLNLCVLDRTQHRSGRCTDRSIALESGDPFRESHRVCAHSTQWREHIRRSRGTGLSGGQRQHIRLTRAVYRMQDFLYLEKRPALSTPPPKVSCSQTCADCPRPHTRCDRASPQHCSRRRPDRSPGSPPDLETGSHHDLVAREGAYHRLFAINSDPPPALRRLIRFSLGDRPTKAHVALSSCRSRQATRESAAGDQS